MFRRVREATFRGRTKTKTLLAAAGRKLRRGALYLGVGALKVAEGALAVVKTAARVVTWTWVGAVEIFSMTWAPYVWVIGNALWAVVRGAGWTVDKIRREDTGWSQKHFPAFTILNAVAMCNFVLYPLVWLVGVLLSPITGRNWWRNTAHGYKVRTISAADFAYADGFREDLNFDATMGEEPNVWEQAVADERMDDGYTAAGFYEFQLGRGYSLVYPEAGKPEYFFDYMVDRIHNDPATDASDEADFVFSLFEDKWGRWWGLVPDGISAQRPTVAEQEHAAKHAAETTVEPPVEPEPEEEGEEELVEVTAEYPVVDPQGLAEFDITQPPDDYKQLHDPRERSFWFGAQWAIKSRQNLPNFLNSEEQQNRARARVAAETRNPATGFNMAYALKGYDAELTRMQEAASHQV